MCRTLTLRVLCFYRNGRHFMICLETDVTVSASSEELTQRKLEKALIAYLNQFSKRQLSEKKYLRLASRKYQMYWYLADRIPVILRLLNIARCFVMQFNIDNRVLVAIPQ